MQLSEDEARAAVAALGHDLQNLLTAAAWNAEALACRLPPELRDSAGEVRRSAEVAASVVHRLLEFGGSPARGRRPVVLQEAVASLEERLRERLGEAVDLELRLPPPPQQVQATPEALEPALLWLARSARQAMPEGGRFTLEVGETTLAAHHTGIPLDPHTRRLLTDPFAASWPAGANLALLITQRLARQAGAALEVDPGGRRAVLTFAGRPSEAAPTPATLLVVEDHPELRRTLQQYLEREGFRVLTAACGREALEQCRDRVVDLVVTDVLLSPMSGPELVRRLAEDRPGLPAIYLSGLPRGPELDPEAPFLEKPFSPGDLVLEVRRLLGRRDDLP